MSRRRQPHRIPPPISHGSETLDSEIVLHEFPDDLGLYLWKTVRTVRLWGEIPEDERSHTFGPEAYGQRLARLRQLSMDADLRESLETAATVLRGDGVYLEGVVTACRLVASWAQARGALGTALEFTQAAALLLPADAELIHTVAWLARRRGEHARAESWYRQAINVSRRSHDWISLAVSYLGLGATFLQRGSHASARQTLVRGIRAATRHSLWEERALLSHELARVAMRTERPAEVVRSGRAALEAYGPDHPRTPLLATDLGVFWVRAGYHSVGRSVLVAVDPRALDPPERLAWAGGVARAAAVSGDAALLEVAWMAAGDLLHSAPASPETALALLDLARGTAALGEVDRPREAAERARRAAEICGESTLRSNADTLLSGLVDGALPPFEPDKKAPRELRRLAEELAAAFTSPAEAA